MSIVPRNRWCTVPQASWWRPTRMRLPAAEVWLHHGAAGTSSTATANGYAAYHIRDKQWGEIGYSWIIAGGRILEGRGAGVEGAHTRGRNGISHGICVAGNYTSRQPSTEDLDALVWLLQHGHRQGWWNRPQLTGGHRDAPGATTSCPGDRLQTAIPDINRRAAGPNTEDDMPYSDWPKADRDALAADVRRAVLGGLPDDNNLWPDPSDGTPRNMATFIRRTRVNEQLLKTVVKQLDRVAAQAGVDVAALAAELAAELHIEVPAGASASDVADELAARLAD